MTPQEYLDKIRQLRSPKAIKAICEELTSELFNPDDKPKTKVNKLTPYNKVVKTIPSEELINRKNAYYQTKQDGTKWLRHLHFRYTGLESTNFNAEGGINAGNSKIKRLKNKKIVSVTSYIDTTVQLLQSDDPHELAVGLIAASARRPIEILARGSFERATELPEGVNSDYWVDFKGQAKKRDLDKPESERLKYPIALLVPAKIFLAAFKKFRQMPESKKLIEELKELELLGIEPEEINRKIEGKRGNSLRRVCQKYFNFIQARDDKKVSPTNLRAVCVMLVTKRDCPKNYNNLLWASQELGHFIDDENANDGELTHLLTSIGYLDYYIDEEVPFVGEESQKASQEIPQKTKIAEVQTTSVKLNRTINSKLDVVKEQHNLSNKSEAVAFLLARAEHFLLLEDEILHLKSRIRELELENIKVKSEVQSTDLDSLVEQKIQQQLQKLLLQIQLGEATTIPFSEIKQDSQARVRKEKIDVNYENFTREELLKIKSPSAAREKVRRAFLAICAHNDGQAENSQRWAITNQGLRQLAGTNGLIVGEWLKQHEIAVSDHNSKYGLGLYHNKGRGNIVESISWD
jgi:Telomere resolvase